MLQMLVVFHLFPRIITLSSNCLVRYCELKNDSIWGTSRTFRQSSVTVLLAITSHCPHWKSPSGDWSVAALLRNYFHWVLLMARWYLFPPTQTKRRTERNVNPVARVLPWPMSSSDHSNAKALAARHDTSESGGEGAKLGQRTAFWQPDKAPSHCHQVNRTALPSIPESEPWTGTLTMRILRESREWRVVTSHYDIGSSLKAFGKVRKMLRYVSS